MPVGPGKYDDWVTKIREETQARCVVLMVVDGNKGTSFCVQSHEDISIALPELLRDTASSIESSIQDEIRPSIGGGSVLNPPSDSDGTEHAE